MKYALLVRHFGNVDMDGEPVDFFWLTARTAGTMTLPTGHFLVGLADSETKEIMHLGHPEYLTTPLERLVADLGPVQALPYDKCPLQKMNIVVGTGISPAKPGGFSRKIVCVRAFREEDAARAAYEANCRVHNRHVGDTWKMLETIKDSHLRVVA